MLQTYLLIHNLFFFSLIILYHVLSMFLSIWEECVRSIYYSFYRINTRLCIEKFLFVCEKFFYKDIIIYSLLFLNTFSLHDNHFLSHKRSFKKQSSLLIFYVCIDYEPLTWRKALTSHSFERYWIFYGSLMNLFQKGSHVLTNPETGSVYNHDVYIKNLWNIIFFSVFSFKRKTIQNANGIFSVVKGHHKHKNTCKNVVCRFKVKSWLW